MKKIGFLLLLCGNLSAATIVIDNLTDLGDGAYGVRDAGGSLITGTDFRGVVGRFTITNSAIASSFASNDLAAIQAGFQQFDPVNGDFVLDNLDEGAFQASESFDTRNTVNPGFGGSRVYIVLMRGTSISSASELFIAELNYLFPTDPEIGVPLLDSFSLRPDTVLNLVVGYDNQTAHDYGFGSGPLPTFMLAEAIPEPGRVLLLGLSGSLMLLRRRRPLAA